MSIYRIIIWATFLASLFADKKISWAQPKANQNFGKDATFSFNIHTLSFIKNNEYFGPFVEGHTLAGYQLRPHFSYSSSGITTKFGLFLQRDWAATSFLSKVSPIFTLKYQKGVTTFLIGNLDNSHQSQRLEPLYDAERMFMQHPETGLRIYHTGSHTFIDLWLHWLTLLDKSHHIPEEFSAGFACEKLLLSTKHASLYLPLQVILYHLGGQGVPLQDYSLWVGSLGGRVYFPISENSFFKSLELAAYYLANYYVKQPIRPFLKGQGFYGQLTCQTAWITLQASYWNAHKFSSENLGHPLYQSIQLANKQVTYQEAHRHLVFLHLSYIYNLTKELELVLHIDPYYDINHHLLEHEAGFYIKYSPCFELMGIEESSGNN